MAKRPQYYLGDPNLPAFGAEFEYTPEMIQELKKCKADILHFMNYFYIIDPDKGRTIIKPYKFQKKIIKALTNNRYNILISARQASKTTLFTIFALWVACFNNDQYIVIVANKEATAKEIFRRFKLAYEELPEWLKPAIKEYAQTSATFANGTRVSISTTTGSAARGSTVNCIDGSTLITIRNKKTNKIEIMPVKEFYNMISPNKEIPIELEHAIEDQEKRAGKNHIYIRNVKTKKLKRWDPSVSIPDEWESSLRVAKRKQKYE